MDENDKNGTMIVMTFMCTMLAIQKIIIPSQN
jgi:hypothetical protein